MGRYFRMRHLFLPVVFLLALALLGLSPEGEIYAPETADTVREVRWSAQELLTNGEAYCLRPDSLAFMTKDGCLYALTKLRRELQKPENNAAGQAMSLRRGELLEEHTAWCAEFFPNLHDRKGCRDIGDALYGRLKPARMIQEEEGGNLPGSVRVNPMEQTALFQGMRYQDPDQTFDQPRKGRTPRMSANSATSSSSTPTSVQTNKQTPGVQDPSSPLMPKDSSNPSLVPSSSLDPKNAPAIVPPPTIFSPGTSAPSPNSSTQPPTGLSIPRSSSNQQGSGGSAASAVFANPPSWPVMLPQIETKEDLPPVPPVGRVVPPIVPQAGEYMGEDAAENPSVQSGRNEPPLLPNTPDAFADIIPNYIPPAPPSESEVRRPTMPAGQIGR